MSTWLVTGSSGGLGAELCRALAADGETVRGFDMAAPPSDMELDHMTKGDIRDESLMREALEGVDVVAHMAALTWIDSDASPERALEVNCVATARLFRLALEMPNQPRIVVASSGSVLAPNDSMEVRGAVRPLEGRLPNLGVYAATKYMTEALADHARGKGLEVSCLRFSAMLFPHVGVGFARELVRELIEKPISGEPSHVRFGDDTLNWLASRDAVRAIRAVAAQMERGPVQSVFNVLGEPRPLHDVVEYVRTRIPDNNIELDGGTGGFDHSQYESDLTSLIGDEVASPEAQIDEIMSAYETGRTAGSRSD